jgi:hypothetical protein
MSTDFTPGRRIYTRDLFDGRLEKFGVHEWVAPDRAPNDGQDNDLWVLLTLQSAQARILTDGQGNYLWVSIDDDGSVAIFTRYGRNDSDGILAAVTAAFETEIFSEDEPQFWGFETNEELDGYIREIYLAVTNKAQGRASILLPGSSLGKGTPDRATLQHIRTRPNGLVNITSPTPAMSQKERTK